MSVDHLSAAKRDVAWLQVEIGLDEEQLAIVRAIKAQAEESEAVLAAKIATARRQMWCRQRAVDGALRPAATKRRDASVGNSTERTAPAFPAVNRGAA